MSTQEFDNKQLEQVCNWLGNYTERLYNKEIKEFFLKLDKKFCKNHITCPNCQGFGKIEEKYNAYPQGLPDSMWGEKWEYREVECPACKGKGWADHKLEPITETKITGWK